MAVAQGTCVVMQVCTMMIKRALCLFVSLHVRQHRHLIASITTSACCFHRSRDSSSAVAIGREDLP